MPNAFFVLLRKKYEVFNVVKSSKIDFKIKKIYLSDFERF